jgi:hypothetical protein
MGGERFDTESFCGVMAAEQEIHPKLFSSYRSPVRRFARDKSVDPCLGYPLNFSTRPSGNDSYRISLLWC